MTTAKRDRLQASIAALEHQRNELLQCIDVLEELLRARSRAAVDRVRDFCDGWELDHGAGAHPVVLQGLNHMALAFDDLRELLNVSERGLQCRSACSAGLDEGRKGLSENVGV